mmetsp:Transcript_25938/g.59940  ORF Transcript_25938/g.59940 Transcript_25938/m.59940 type:complete len:566 (-) Transcript_25938:68-1765(-)
MVDYSKWDKLECSSSEDEGSRAAPVKQGRPLAKGAPGRGGQIPCPPELGSEFAKMWDTLPLQKKLMVLEHLKEDPDNTGRPAVKYHPEKSLHQDLFKPDQWQRWIHPSLLKAISAWRVNKEKGAKNNFSGVNLDEFPECRVEAPGVISFPALNDEFCEALLEEVKHYRKSGLPGRAPNSMNNYGLVLNEVGLRDTFTALLDEVFLPIGAKVFGDEADRARKIHGVETGTEDWGGSTLDDHHSFVVLYQPDGDKHLDMHIDECDVTFNFAITSHENFEGSDLAFCGMFDADNHRKYHHEYKHIKGRCVLHSGKRRHGALDIEKGERASLIMWTKSRSFRRKPAYMLRQDRGLNHGEADRVCLSYTHDPDYKKLMPKKLQYNMTPRSDADADVLSVGSGSTAVPSEKRWVKVCADSELEEGAARKISFERENEQVAVFRHRGQLFALDNRCAHMGGPLCEGDIEDLEKHLPRPGVEMLQGSEKEDGVVKCPRHGMCFNIRTGRNIKGGGMKQRTFPVRLSTDGQDIEVEVELEVDVDTAESPLKEGAANAEEDAADAPAVPDGTGSC